MFIMDKEVIGYTPIFTKSQTDVSGRIFKLSTVVTRLEFNLWEPNFVWP